MKESVDIVLGCMDLDLSLSKECLIATAWNPNEAKLKKMGPIQLLIIKRFIPEMIRVSITESTSANKFLETIAQ